MERRHVLIGTGPAAVAAAEAIRGADADAAITLVGADPAGYYSRPGLAYYFAAEIPERRLFPFTRGDFARLRLSLVADRVTAVDPEAHRVSLASGGTLAYDRLLIATGSQAVRVKVPGAELDGVVKLDDLEDARDLIARCKKAKRAVVAGGGITALEIVEGFHARHVPVDYLMRQERYWRNVLSESESQLVEEGLRRVNVTLHHHTELVRIVGRDGHVAAVETADGKVLPCDLVAIAIGVRPLIGLAKAAGIACERGILVDAHLRSSDEHIYAAGDVAEAVDRASGRRTLEVLWNSAVTKGRIAGLNMATAPEQKLDKGLALNITRLAGYKTTIIGRVGSGEDRDLETLTRGDSQTWSELEPAALVEAPVPGAQVRLALGDSVIMGALVMGGDQTLSLPLQELVAGRADVSAIAGSLQEHQAPVADIVTRFWREWSERRDAEPSDTERHDTEQPYEAQHAGGQRHG
jgi:NAD(P)H-nitrite reductase large subunit